jgi:hypothetical protein
MFASLFILLLAGAQAGHIYAGPVAVRYSFAGVPLYYTLRFSLTTPFPSDGYLNLVLPAAVHSASDKTTVAFVLRNGANGLVLAQYKATGPADTNPQYWGNPGTPLEAGTWYLLDVYPTTVPASRGIVSLSTTASPTADGIIYDTNPAHSELNLGSSAVASSLTVTVTGQSSTPGATSIIEVSSTSVSAWPSGSFIELDIYYDAAVAAQTTVSSSAVLDFSMASFCQSKVGFTATVCTLVSVSKARATFSANHAASATFTLQVGIKNPVYASVRGIQWSVFSENGASLEWGKLDTALSCTTLSLASTSPRFKMLWGIDSTYSDANSIWLGIYSAAAGGRLGPANSLNIGFQVASPSPLSTQFTVALKTLAAGVLEGSIVTNLPAVSGKSVICLFNVASTEIRCSNVGPLIRTSYRYFIAFKAYYAANAGPTLADFGRVRVDSVVTGTSGLLTGIKLYAELAGDTMNVRQNAEYLDTTGWHNKASYKLGDVQVITAADDASLTSTGTAANNMMTGSNVTAGIDPSQANQNLLFLLKVASAQYDSAGVSSNEYTYKIIYNPNVISLASGSSAKGIDFAAYSTAMTGFVLTSFSCFSYGIRVCQRFNDTSQTTNTQSVVSLSGVPVFGLYNFKCGSTTAADCAQTGGATCLEECNLFQGYSAADRAGGVFAMRQVNFPAGYQSSLYADSQVLDFVVQIFEGTTLVSSQLINAFTVQPTVPVNLK